MESGVIGSAVQNALTVSENLIFSLNASSLVHKFLSGRNLCAWKCTKIVREPTGVDSWG